MYKNSWTEILIAQFNALVRDGHNWRVFLDGKVVTSIGPGGSAGPVIIVDGSAEYTDLFGRRPGDFDVFGREPDLLP